MSGEKPGVWREIGGFLKGAAPALATAFGGPVGGIVARTALQAVSSATGTPGAKPEQVLAALKDGAVDLGALKEADTAFEARMRELDIDLERIAAGDRASARKMWTALGGDWTGRALALGAATMLVGLGGVVAFMAITGSDMTPHVKELMLLLIGHVSGFAGAAYTFYFGSSAGERKAKD